MTTKKLSAVKLELDEANQTIGALRFENNFLVEKTKKLEAELFHVRAQLEMTSSTKVNEMLSLQKSASDRIGLGYDFSSPSIASTSTTVFVAPTNNVETENNDVKNELASENVDKGKSILGAPLSLIRKILRTLGLRRETLKSLSRKNIISVITTTQLDIPNLIATSG